MKSLAKRVIEGLFSERLSVDYWFSATTLWKLYLERLQKPIEFSSFLEGLNAFHDKVEVVERNEIVCRLLDPRFCRGRLKDCIGELSEEILASLAKVVAEEDWTIPGKPDAPYALLKNYLFQIFKRAYYENKLFVSDRFLIFNTGLYDKSRRNVYYGLLETREGCDCAPYSFYAWRPEKHIPEWEGGLPALADFLEMLKPYNPNSLHMVDYEHIAISNRRRLDFLNVPNSDTEGRGLLLSLLEGCVQSSFRRAKARDFRAIPTYFTSQNRVEKVQYLIPLYYDNMPKAALVLNIKKDRYDIETVLTLEMAYQNARVINNINHTWLKEVFSSSKRGVKEEASRVHALLKDANGGRGEAWLQLARIYDTGDGVSVDQKKAFLYYQKAAECDVLTAYRYLGECYFYGRGIGRDEGLARRSWVRGAIKEDADSQYELARMLLLTPRTECHQQAVVWVKKAVANGHLKAKELLGECYCNGWGIKRDKRKGVECLKEMVQQNSLSALEVLGRFYIRNGQSRKAVQCFEKGKGRESVYCLSFLSYCYYWGDGVGKDVNLAQIYLSQAKALDSEHPNVNAMMGYFYLDGVGGEKNFSKAFDCFQKALMGEGFAFYSHIGYCFSEGAGVEKSLTKAVEYYKMGAELGSALAQNNLAVCYREGEGVDQDYEQAIKWFRKAAAQGNASAQFNMGGCYSNGYGVAQDYVEAVKWYRRAAEQGEAEAQHDLGVCYQEGRGVEQSYVEAVKWYRKAVERGYARAEYNLGICYDYGHGVEKSHIDAVKWYRRAAEQGLAQAQYNLGICYSNGCGVNQSHVEAVQWYCKAASQGFAEAQFNLGVSYENGYGIARSYTEAVKWYRKAAEQGFVTAQFNLGVCYQKGKGVKQSYEEAAVWFRKAAEQGLMDAQYNLGVYYSNGYGVEQSYEVAVKWYRLAAKQGDEFAKKALEHLAGEV